jgi:hypothetical protein
MWVSNWAYGEPKPKCCWEIASIAKAHGAEDLDLRDQVDGLNGYRNLQQPAFLN